METASMAEKSKERNVPTAAEIGRIGGLNSRKYLEPEARKELASRAAKARWDKWRSEKAKTKAPVAKKAASSRRKT
jgi:hypothetical protein